VKNQSIAKLRAASRAIKAVADQFEEALDHAADLEDWCHPIWPSHVESLRDLAKEIKEVAATPAEKKKQIDRERAGYLRKAKQIIKCGETAHDWEGSTDDGGYWWCKKCKGYTDERKVVWLSMFDRMSGASETQTLPKKLQSQLIASRGGTPDDGV
jgi:hypothetical protein